MAYQPKSYKKFVATAATATLVASAIVPVALANEATVAFTDVSAIYKDAVDYLVSENLSNGLTETEFGINANIKRGDAAIILAKALGIQDDAEAAPSGFSDVPTRASLAINSLKAAGVIKGKTATRFGFEDNLTRGEVALILANVKAYNYAGDVSKLKFTDVIGTRYASAVAGMVEAGITQGKTATSFGTGDAIKRGDFAIFIYKAEGSPALKANVDTLEINAEGNEFTLMFNRMIPADADIKWLADNYSITINGNAATEAQLTALKLEVKSLSADGKTLVVTHTDLDELGLDGESVELSIGGAKDTYTFEVSTDAVLESVMANTVKSIQVTFAEPVDSTLAKFAVKKGTTTVGVASITWNEDKTVAQLELNSKLTEGKYDVSVTGVSEEALTGSVVTQNEKVTDINFLSDSLIVTKAATSELAGTATAGYQVLNQYGEDVTANTALAGNLKYTTSKGTADDDNKGKLIVLTSPGTKVGDKIVVTAIDENTAVTANTTFTVVDEAKVAAVTLGDVYNKDGKTLSEDTNTEPFYVLLDAKDQYGNAVTDVTKANEQLTVLSSNPMVNTITTEAAAIVEITIGDKKQLAIKLEPKAAGDSLLTVITNANGTSVSKTVTVAPGVKVDTVAIGTPEGTITGNKTILIPVEVTDNTGAAVTKAADVKNVTLTASGNGVDSEVDPTFVDKDGKVYISLKTASVATNTVGTIVLTAQTPTQKLSSKVFQVQANAVATALVGLDSEVLTSILRGETLEIADGDFIVEDQYGNRITDDSYVITGNSSDPDPKAFTVTSDTVNDVNNVLASTDTNAPTTGTVTFSLGGTTPVSTIDVKFTAVKTSDFTSYKAVSVGTVYASADPAYAKSLKVYGVTSDGKEVLLPSTSNLYSVTNLNGYTYTGGKLSGTTAGLDNDVNTVNPDTKDASATVVINATGGELNVTGKVTVVAPKATTASVRVGGAKAGDVLTTVEETVDATLTVADLAGLTYVADQYGVEYVEGSATTDDIKLTFTNLVNANANDLEKPAISGNGTESATIANFGTGDTVTVKITVGGATTTVNVTGTVTPSNATVNSNQALIVALANPAVTKIILGNDLNTSFTANRKVDFDLNGYTLNGDVSYTTLTATGVITLSSTTSGGRVTGNLTVNTPAADFVVGSGVTVNGTTTINDVAASTFTNNGTLGAVIINDTNGTRFVNNGQTGDVQLNTSGSVTLGGTISKVVVQQSTSVVVEGTVEELSVNEGATVTVETTGDGEITSSTGKGTILSFFENFSEGNNDVFKANGSATVVNNSDDETISVMSTNGSTDGVFTNFGEYSSEWLTGGYITKVKVYIDPADMEVGEGFTWSSALNNTEGKFLGEQLTHIRKLEDNTVRIGNKSGVSNTQVEQYTIDAISEAGYYTIQTRYYEESGIVKAELKVINENNVAIHTSNPVVLKNSGDLLSDITTTEAGGNRYGWFTYLNMGESGLKITEVSLEKSAS